MKVLMFGWEFPPHISGGLGTACQGLVKGLSEIPGIFVTFVVPKIWGDETGDNYRLIGGNEVVLREQLFPEIHENEGFNQISLPSGIIPYQTPEQFWAAKSRRLHRDSRFVEVTEEGTLKFSGSYGESLYGEIRNYALIAEHLAMEESFDLVHAHDWLAFPAGMAAARKAGKPLIVHVHATEFDRSGGDINPRVYAIEREGMEYAARIITVSHFTRRTVIERYGIHPSKVITIHNAVEQWSGSEKENLKKGLPGKIVSFIGRITLQKGPEYFVETAHLLLQKMNNVRFVMAGSGDRMPAVVEQAARLGLSRNFHFTGFLNPEEVRRLLAISDALVMPSVSEPFGIVPLEAMRCGVPVIVSRQSGVSEIVRYALKADFWDTHAIADALWGLLNYPVLSNLLIRKGKEETGSMGWEKTAEEVFKLYRQLNFHYHAL